jgi:hypothetical protein
MRHFFNSPSNDMQAITARANASPSAWGITLPFSPSSTPAFANAFTTVMMLHANRTPGRFAIGGLDCRSVTLSTGMGCGV